MPFPHSPQDPPCGLFNNYERFVRWAGHVLPLMDYHALLLVGSGSLSRFFIFSYIIIGLGSSSLLQNRDEAEEFVVRVLFVEHASNCHLLVIMSDGQLVGEGQAQYNLLEGSYAVNGPVASNDRAVLVRLILGTFEQCDLACLALVPLFVFAFDLFCSCQFKVCSTGRGPSNVLVFAVTQRSWSGSLMVQPPWVRLNSQSVISLGSLASS